MRSGEILVAS